MLSQLHRMAYCGGYVDLRGRKDDKVKEDEMG
jgi:hypothetical protein